MKKHSFSRIMPARRHVAGQSRLRLEAGLTALACALFVTTTVAASNHIAVVDVSGQRGQAAVGETVSLDLAMDFDDTTIGGGFQVDYDPSVLQLVDFVFDDRGLGDEQAFRCSPATRRCTARGGAHRVPVGFGRFDGLTGARPIGHLRMRAIGEGASAVEIVPHATTGPFVDLTGAPLAVTSDELTVRVVPEPAFATALVAGSIACAAFRRRRSRR